MGEFLATDPKRKLSNLPRKPARYPVDLPATFRVKGEQDWHMGTLINLSAGGFCLQTGTVMKSNMVLELLFDTVGKGRRKHRRLVLARIVWKRLTRYGLEFVRSSGKKGLF